MVNKNENFWKRFSLTSECMSASNGFETTVNARPVPSTASPVTSSGGSFQKMMRIRKFLTQEQAITLVNAYILSPFNFCPLVWMFCSKQAHNLISSVHYKALCAKFNTFEYNFEQLLQMSDSCTIHDRNLKLLVIEIYKTLHRLNPEIMWGSFKLKPNTYNLRQGHSLVVPIAKSSSATNYFDFRASLEWNHLQSSIENEKTLIKFKRSLRPHKIYCKCKGCIWFYYNLYSLFLIYCFNISVGIN